MLHQHDHQIDPSRKNLMFHVDRKFKQNAYDRKKNLYKTLLSWEYITLHPQSLTWNLRMIGAPRNILFHGLIFRFHVKLQGCGSRYACQPRNFHSFRMWWHTIQMALDGPSVMHYEQWIWSHRIGWNASSSNYVSTNGSNITNLHSLKTNS